MTISSRRRRISKTRNQHLPEEIIEDILVKLPVKSIIRFQSVSKSWFDLIKSSRFIRKHFVESEESFLAACFVVGRRARQESRFTAVSVYDDEDSSGTRFNEGVINICDSTRQSHRLARLNYELPFSYNFLLNLKGYPEWHVVGDCNGILCLTNYKNIMLVNPSLREVKTLPNLIPHVDDDPHSCELVGFGFDNKRKDFKVAQVLSYYWNGVVVRYGFQVYDLRSNAWRELDRDDLDFASDALTGLYIFFNGLIYWCARTEYFGWGILTFNVGKNYYFNKMEFPQKNIMEFPQEVKESKEDPSICLFVLNQESLAFLSYSPTNSSRSLVNVWIMNEHETWTKLYSIGPLTQFRKPKCFWKKDKFLYLTTTGKLVSYDLHNHNRSVVCDDALHLRSFYDDSTEICLELGLGIRICRSSLFSINNI